VRIRWLETMQEMIEAEDLSRELEAELGEPAVSARLLLDLALNGGVVIGAYHADSLVGFVYGFLAADHKTPERVVMARLKHHSQGLTVRKEYREEAVAFELKCAQREAIVEQGVRLMTWTYDPMDTFQARLTLRQLGAVVRTYLPDRYGKPEGKQSPPLDRVQAEWWVTTRRVNSRVTGERPMLDLANYLGAGAVKVNPSILGTDDLLRPAEHTTAFESSVALVEIPANYNVILERDSSLAQSWRAQTRALFENAFRHGYLATDFIILEEETFPRAYYILSHGEGTLGA
jgi:predicted GNAT superfamily acetyltransferase